jgi:hypothetical protein
MCKQLPFAAIVLACMVVSGGAGCSKRTQYVPAERAGAWKNFHGTHESLPFRVENGKGFDYTGENHDEPSTPIVSREDWVVVREGRTYVLYEVDPGNLEPNGFHYMDEETEEFEKAYNESLWIGLLGEDGEIVRKTRLGTGLRDISGIQTGADGRDQVTALDAQGRKRTIPLKYPLPWPPLDQKGCAWERYNERIQREVNRIGEDWPGNASGYAAQWQDNAMQPFLDKERRQAVETLRTRPMTKACRACLEREPDRSWMLAWEATEGVGDQAGNVHWGSVVASEERDRFVYPFLRNWLEGYEHPGGWMLVCNARGEFNGETFTATNGVALVGLDGWNKRLREEEEIDRWGLLRLAPERVRKEDGRTFVEFELIMPQFMDSAWKAGHGTFVAEEGTLHLQELSICLDFPWLRGIPGVTVED